MGIPIAAEPLLSLAVTVTSEQRVESVLRKIVEVLASQPGVALARIWLLPSIHLPSPWPEVPHSSEDVEYLHLVASAGKPINSPGEDWSCLQGRFARFPLNIGKVGQVAAERHPILIKDFAPQDSWIVRPEWAEREGIRSFAGYPLLYQDKLLGVIGVFSRRPLEQQELTWLGVFANYAAVAITNALAFEKLENEIAERARAEEKLRESEAYLAEAQRRAHMGTWVWRVEGREALYLSDEWYRIYGFNPEEGVPNWEQRLERIHPEDRAIWQDAIERAIRDRSDYEVEFRILLPTGIVKCLNTVGHRVTDTSGDLVKFVGISTDITERKRAEEERERLRQLQADLAHMNRVTTMGELAASLAHEIKQPISAAALDAGTCLEWLARDRPDIEEAREAASRVIQDVKRASEIIGRVRSLFKKGEPQRELIDVNEIIREMIVLLRSEAGRYSISIHTDLAAGLPTISADRVQLQQVFMNLMLNAIDAMREINGARELTIKSRPSTYHQVLISVSDTGIGLPSELSDKIFDAFFTTKPQGTGMGLSITRSIIESHGGRLWATVGPGWGTTFQFTLPSDTKAE